LLHRNFLHQQRSQDNNIKCTTVCLASCYDVMAGYALGMAGHGRCLGIFVLLCLGCAEHVICQGAASLVAALQQLSLRRVVVIAMELVCNARAKA
jgi:hypothetical protein